MIIGLGRKACAMFALTLFALPAVAQSVLPDVHVIGHDNEQRHGGYLISHDFRIDPKLSSVIYPSEPLQKDDILSVQPLRLKDDEYFVLQECVSADCTQAQIVRVWTKQGTIPVAEHDPNRVWVGHDGKFFLWMQRFPARGGHAAVFDDFERFSPPLVLKPRGDPELFQVIDVVAAQQRGPTPVKASKVDGESMMLKFDTGTVVHVMRMHAAN